MTGVEGLEAWGQVHRDDKRYFPSRSTKTPSTPTPTATRLATLDLQSCWAVGQRGELKALVGSMQRPTQGRGFVGVEPGATAQSGTLRHNRTAI